MYVVYSFKNGPFFTITSAIFLHLSQCAIRVSKSLSRSELRALSSLRLLNILLNSGSGMIRLLESDLAFSTKSLKYIYFRLRLSFSIQMFHFLLFLGCLFYKDQSQRFTFQLCCPFSFLSTSSKKGGEKHIRKGKTLGFIFKKLFVNI